MASRLRCAQNLKRIGMALHNYHQDYECFPPLYVADDEGRALYSWRVLLLPYLGYSELYERWDREARWNGEHNLPLARRHLDVFRCPGAAGSVVNTASAASDYLAVVGECAAWEARRCLSLSDFSDGAGLTLMVIEVTDSEVNWAEPDGLNAADILHTSTDNDGQVIRSKHHRDMTHALFADGSVYVLWEDLPKKDLKAILTRNGGECVDLGAPAVRGPAIGRAPPFRSKDYASDGDSSAIGSPKPQED